MESIFNKEMIAFQSVDREGGIWCNVALLFESEEEVKLFFNNSKKVIEVLGLELDEEMGETEDNCIEIVKWDGDINVVTITLVYCGEKVFKRMSKGFFIRN